jgi:hypothetical protein
MKKNVSVGPTTKILGEVAAGVQRCSDYFLGLKKLRSIQHRDCD